MTTQGGRPRPGHVPDAHRLPAAAGRSSTRRSASLVSKELGDADAPSCPTSSASRPQRFFNLAAYGPGFLGPQYAPLVVGESGRLRRAARPRTSTRLLKVQDLDRPTDVDDAGRSARSTCSARCRRTSLATGPAPSPPATPPAYDRAVRLMQSDGRQGVRPRPRSRRELRDRYGRNAVRPGLPAGPPAGRARRAVRRGRRLERLGHAQQQLRPGEAALRHARPGLGDADGRPEGPRPARHDADRLDGRVRPHAADQPRRRGRDHCPNAWSDGAGRRRHQGRPGRRQDQHATAPTVEERPGRRSDLLATVCQALGIDPEKQNMSNVGRPIRIVDKTAKPVTEVLA